MILNVNAQNGNYDVVIERGCLSRAGELLNLNRKVLVVTDSGVPADYAKTVASQCAHPVPYTVESGEHSKNFENYLALMRCLTEHSFTRGDAVVAVGGGVVGDLSGFVAATYMRGIDFYNVPTTLLSQVDSSIGGKTAVNFNGIKNIVGAFYQPKRVLIDTQTLRTLDVRRVHAGLFEAIKMAATCSAELFEIVERSENLWDDVDEIVYRSLVIKKQIVESDALEKGVRKILNFGHTVGHAIEASCGGALLHGECVALGMLPFSSAEVRARLQALYRKYAFDWKVPYDKTQVLSLIAHDKKAQSDGVEIIFAPAIGSYAIRKLSLSQIETYL